MRLNWLRAFSPRATPQLREIVAKTIDDEQWPGEQAFTMFMERAGKFSAPRVLELGTRQAMPGRSTRKQFLFPNAVEYIGTDIEPGVDVDLIGDVHRPTKFTGEEAFDIVLT